MPKARTVKDVIGQIVPETASEREKAVVLHDLVRNNVKFDFNKYFDATHRITRCRVVTDTATPRAI